MNSKLLWRGGILGVLIGFGELSLYTNINAFDQRKMFFSAKT